VLAIISGLSLGARAAALGEPCQSPCHRAGEHTLIFDEAYYVNAARVIAGIHPPPGAHYADAPLGTDPNAEHPQGAKLIMAASIELFGDGPLAWRLGSVVFGTIAILGMYALVRAAGGGPWSAVGAAGLMACDNLLLVHGRIGTLDIYTVAGMVWGVAFYLRGWRWPAALAFAVAAAFKLVAPYAVLVLALLELGRLITVWRRGEGPAHWRLAPALARFLTCTIAGVAVFMGLLWVMGEATTPYADATARLITGGPIAHLEHMITYAAQQVSPHGPTGIASYPWQWLVDLKPIVYLQISPSLPGAGLYAIHPESRFLGMVSPPIMLLALPALAFCAYRLLRPRRQAEGAAVGLDGVVVKRHGAVVKFDVGELQLAILGVAWFIGTWLPFELLSVIDSRTSYLYYMVIVMPGIYVAVTYLIASAWRLRRRLASGAVTVWALGVVVAVVVMYPFTPLF